VLALLQVQRPLARDHRHCDCISGVSSDFWDFRFNHIHLPRTTSLIYRQAVDGSSVSGPFFTYHTQSPVLPFTHEGGWGGMGEGQFGAPFGAARRGDMGMAEAGLGRPAPQNGIA